MTKNVLDCAEEVCNVAFSPIQFSFGATSVIKAKAFTAGAYAYDKAKTSLFGKPESQDNYDKLITQMRSDIENEKRKKDRKHRKKKD